MKPHTEPAPLWVLILWALSTLAYVGMFVWILIRWPWIVAGILACLALGPWLFCHAAHEESPLPRRD